jgi:hypothetical protein
MSADAKIWLAAGVTDMRRGFNGLAAQTEQVLVGDPYSGYLGVVARIARRLLDACFADRLDAPDAAQVTRFTAS